MPSPEDIEFNQRIHETLRPVGERYVEESGHGEDTFFATYAADFDPRNPMFNYLQTHFEAHPLRPRVAEMVSRLVTTKLAQIPNEIMNEVLIPAFAERADEILEHRQHRPIAQLVDHTPDRLAMGTQLAGNLALANRLAERHLRPKELFLPGLIRRAHGLGTIGYRQLGIRPVPGGPGIIIGQPARLNTHTHYVIPATAQYRDLDWHEGDKARLSEAAAGPLWSAANQEVPPVNVTRGGVVLPGNLNIELLVNPTGTKQQDKGDKVVIPRVSSGIGKFVIDGLGLDILEVYTSFKFDKEGKIVDGHCEVGEIVKTAEAGDGVVAVRDYMTRLAAYRSKHEDRPVVYADAA